MAKGLRSKTKRRARTLLRETLSGPLAVKRQQKIAENIKSSLGDKSFSSILKLKSVLLKGDKQKKSSDTVQDTEDEEAEKPCGENKAYPSSAIRRPSKFVIESKLRKTGKQPRRNEGKELVWFK
jgi:DNA helicase IV